MKIQIVGLGIVGTAQAYLCQELKQRDVVGYDPKFDDHLYCRTNDHIVGDVDMTFICTPESIVEDVINSLIEVNHKGIIVIRSTVPIGTIKYLSEKFGIHICHNPEFLREEYYLDDIINPNMVVIGQCCQTHGDLLESFYQSIDKPIIRVDIANSELIKLTNNAYLSILITFWNEINELCDKLNIDAKDISNTIRCDPRISNYGCEFFGTPYGGKCLPKDIDHLIAGFRTQGLNPKLFEACESFNNHIIEKSQEKLNKKSQERLNKKLQEKSKETGV